MPAEISKLKDLLERVQRRRTEAYNQGIEDAAREVERNDKRSRNYRRIAGDIRALRRPSGLTFFSGIEFAVGYCNLTPGEADHTTEGYLRQTRGVELQSRGVPQQNRGVRRQPEG